MSALLARLVAAHKADHAAARGIPLGCLAQVLQAFGGKGNMQDVGPDAAAVPGLVQQQTGRELKVLAAGSPNTRIAEELVVALDTVNLHLTT